MLEGLAIIAFVAVVLFVVVSVGKISWHFQGLGILALCLVALGVAALYGPQWFGI